ncbi:MAG TPA: TetR/AcrR family transcriptional regulator [Pirellulales bacterium]|nr:TetR/AcrR family transcriptional regulator [Pirellulales bacterium]
MQATECSTATLDRRAVRRDSIIEAAARRFAGAGYAQCDMDCVAAEAGVAKGTLYLYFPGKEELFYACVDRGMQQLMQAVFAAADTATEPLDRIGRAIRAYLTFFDEHPHYVELLIQERASFRDRKRSTYFEHRDANRGPWRELYGKLVADSTFRNDIAVERMLDTIGNLLYGTMFTNRFNGRSVSLDEQYSALMKIVLQGMLRDRALVV